jgi:hypothetical protein
MASWTQDLRYLISSTIYFRSLLVGTMLTTVGSFLDRQRLPISPSKGRRHLSTWWELASHSGCWSGLAMSPYVQDAAHSLAAPGSFPNHGLETNL